MMLSVIDCLNEKLEPVKDFILSQSSNPFFWLGLFLAGVLVFSVVYGILHRD